MASKIKSRFNEYDRDYVIIYVDFISVNRFFEFRLKSFEWCLSCLSQRLCACFGEVCSWLARGCKVAGGWSA